MLGVVAAGKIAFLGSKCSRSDWCDRFVQHSDCIENACMCSEGYHQRGSKCSSNKSKFTWKKNVIKNPFQSFKKSWIFSEIQESCDILMECEHFGGICHDGKCTCPDGHFLQGKVCAAPKTATMLIIITTVATIAVLLLLISILFCCIRYVYARREMRNNNIVLELI